MTKGEYRVGINFNPGNNDVVWQIKSAAAALIDLINALPTETHTIHDSHIEVHMSSQAMEVGRLKALAMTAIEEGAMWAVKAATKPALEENK